ncbi:hypothetical protein [Scytonema sp. NUACC26]|uniref:hypothetical protein n=1 Tax=Scytonema sp. NUACC26 TaxID=3140176 RepID=UPI0038B2D992
MLNTIHSSYAYIPFTPGVVLQLHRDLYQFTVGEGGRWKSVDNVISATYPDGTKVTRSPHSFLQNRQNRKSFVVNHSNPI